jgi:hypothetical protein
VTRWWEGPGMTRPADVVEAAKRAAVFLDLQDDSHVENGKGHGLGDVPVVVVQAHGGPWIIYPDPLTILGWVAEQIERHDKGEITVLDGTTGWLGVGDLEPDQIIANLIESNKLPTDAWMNDPPVSTRHLKPDRPAEQPTPQAEASHLGQARTPTELAADDFPISLGDLLATERSVPPSTPVTPGTHQRNNHGTAQH